MRELTKVDENFAIAEKDFAVRVLMTIKGVVLRRNKTWDATIGLMVLICGHPVWIWAMEFFVEQLFCDFQNSLMFADPNRHLFSMEVEGRVLLTAAVNVFSREGFETDGETVVGVVHMKVKFKTRLISGDDFAGNPPIAE